MILYKEMLLNRLVHYDLIKANGRKVNKKYNCIKMLPLNLFFRVPEEVMRIFK